MNESVELFQESVELQENDQGTEDLPEEEIIQEDIETVIESSKSLNDIYDLLSRNAETSSEVLDESFVDYQLNTSLSDIGLIGFGALCFIFFLGLFSFKGVD